MSRSWRLALAQLPGSPDPEANLATARDLCAQAAGQGAQILVLPEMFMALATQDLDLNRVAQPLDGPFGATLAGLAIRHGLHLVAGVWEPAADGRVHNTCALWGPQGELLTAYRKLHLFDAFGLRESDRMAPGDQPPPVVDLGGLKLGLAICYDLRFPEVFRHLSAQGAQAAILPAAWYAGPLKEDHWLTLCKARALENTMYLAGVGLCGAAFVGRSLLADPLGVIRAQAGSGPELVLATIEEAHIQEARAKLPCLGHRRPGLWGAPEGRP